MVDKDTVKTVLEALGDKEVHLTTVEPQNNSTNGSNNCNTKQTCCCPSKVVYLIFCNCVTINNGACTSWGPFCET